ncbi:MAG: MBL fold metallo-hydrolase [Patescibacteria group bacterium]|jgi:competence protein ComEC
MQTFLILVYLAYFFSALSYPKEGLVIEFLDVGFGDSALITTLHGKKVLIDGGGNNEVVTYLGEKMPPGFCKLDVIILTHPHADHLYGLNRVLDYCDVDTVFSNTVVYDSTLYSSWQEDLKLQNVGVRSLYSGEIFYIDGVEFVALWPDRDYCSDNVNNLSKVILMDTGDFEVLFLGDAESEALSKISVPALKEHISDASVEVVKIPHHGSSTAMLMPFYAEIGPKDCVISVGENKYGLPSQEFLDNLKGVGCRVRRTDFEGTVRVVYNLRK